jgi:hypothetical protein
VQIGGIDTDFSSDYSSDESRTRVVRAILDTWPNGVVEEASASEIFVYKEQAALDAWTADGWTEEYAKAMIDVLIIQEDTVVVTCVVEDLEDPESAQILEAVKKCLTKA